MIDEIFVAKDLKYSKIIKNLERQVMNTIDSRDKLPEPKYTLKDKLKEAELLMVTCVDDFPALAYWKVNERTLKFAIDSFMILEAGLIPDEENINYGIYHFNSGELAGYVETNVFGAIHFAASMPQADWLCVASSKSSR